MESCNKRFGEIPFISSQKKKTRRWNLLFVLLRTNELHLTIVLNKECVSNVAFQNFDLSDHTEWSLKVYGNHVYLDFENLDF